MEHIIQIAVSVDDGRIMALAEQAAANELVKQFTGERSGYYRDQRWKSGLSQTVVERLVEEVPRDDIAEAVADRLFRSQKFREKVAGKIAERGE